MAEGRKEGIMDFVGSVPGWWIFGGWVVSRHTARHVPCSASLIELLLVPE